MPTKSNNLIGAFIVGRLLAENAGLSSSQATQWGAVLMATGLSPASILLVTELARLDAKRLSEQPDNQVQLRDTVQQAFQKAQEAAENATRAVEKLEQVTSQLDEFNERMAKLEAWTSDRSCNRETCEEILTTLRELRDYSNFCGISILKPSRRTSGFGCNPFSSLFRFFTNIWTRLLQPQPKPKRTRKNDKPH